MRGHAMEARVCAEDPINDFLPSVGVIEHFHVPDETAFIRVDTAARRGDRIAPFYDSLLAKLIVWGADRDEALRRLRGALGEFEIVGVATNLDLLRAFCDEPAFSHGKYDTGFVEANVERLTRAGAIGEDDEILLLAVGAAKWVANVSLEARAGAVARDDPWSPWAAVDGWRLDAARGANLDFVLNGRHRPVRIQADGADGFRLDIETRRARICFEERGERLRLCVDGTTREVGVLARENEFVVTLAGRNHRLALRDPLQTGAAAERHDRELKAPLPARVSRVLATQGQNVGKGAALVVLEVMKTEFVIAAPRDAWIALLHCKDGEWVAEGADLVTLSDEGAEGIQLSERGLERILDDHSFARRDHRSRSPRRPAKRNRIAFRSAEVGIDRVAGGRGSRFASRSALLCRQRPRREWRRPPNCFGDWASDPICACPRSSPIRAG